MRKKMKTFRFEPELYSRFKELAQDKGYTVTGAFRSFMAACCKQNRIAFPEPAEKPNVDQEARVLLSLLSKNTYWYRACAGGEELSVKGRLFQLLPQIKDVELALSVEKALKQENPHEWIYNLTDAELMQALKKIGPAKTIKKP